ncbi:MAG TPA: zinc ribbon domain-containing protein [Blastocatellia bacterium]|nr:zinc ribbon domain-containing protein [Blastocatellia bacterium]
MNQADQNTTVTIIPCAACGAGLTEDSKFCRWCGVRLALDPDQTERLTFGKPSAPAAYRTAPLAPLNLYHPVSGPLVKAVAAGVPTRTSLSTTGGVTKRVLLALMAIPIWVMIILLSPIDAYASAKIIGQRV